MNELDSYVKKITDWTWQMIDMRSGRIFAYATRYTVVTFLSYENE